MMDDLVTWLSGCLDEDERVARGADNPDHDRWVAGLEAIYRDSGSGVVAVGAYGADLNAEEAAHMVRWDPARVLAEVEAKRAILRLHASRTSIWWPDVEACEVEVCGTCSGEDYEQDHDVEAPCPTIRALALPYRDRPGYRPEWAPQ